MKYIFWLILCSILAVRYVSSMQLNYSNGEVLQVTGRLYSEPAISTTRIKFTLLGIKVALPSYTDIHYGDKVVVKGEYQDGELKDPQLVRVEVSQNIFTNLRRRLLSFYQNNLPEPDASLVAGITIGAKSGLDYDFSTKLKNTGTSHVVVASGMNVTLVSGFILSILISVLERKKALIITIIMIWFYTFISGFEAPILRASVMATIAFSAQAFGRIGNTLRITFLSGWIMLMFVPAWIIDIGFLLSFSTTLSLILFQSKVDRLLHFVPNIFRESLGTSITAQIGSAPIILLVFGRINVLSPVINALVLWVIAPVMIISAIAGSIGIFYEGLGRIILVLVYPMTMWFVNIINIFG